MNNLSKKTLSKDKIIDFLSSSSTDNELFKEADIVRKENVGDEVFLRGLIEFSSICKQYCKYCGLRVENTTTQRYKLDVETIFSFAKEAVLFGYKTIVLQSGENESYSFEQIIEIIKKIKSLKVALTLSIGEKTFEEYKEYKKAGADRFLLRIETTDKDLYKQMHPNMSYDNRINCLYNLKKLGYEVGTGCLVGLPNQTIDSLVNDLLFFKELEADMVGIGPFISCPNTPLENSKNGDFNLALKVMAITRILLPTINIPATTAMETLNENGRIIALQSGANVIMPNIMNEIYTNKYKIYPKNVSKYTSLEQKTKNIVDKLKTINRFVSFNIGNSKHFLDNK